MIVVDAFNVLHVTGVLGPELAGIELADLVWLIAQSRYAGQPLTLVCDGVRPGAGHAGPGACRLGEARVLYAGGGREADDEIENLIARSSYASRMVVVSSDRRLRTAARRARAESICSEAFLEHLARDAGRQRREPLPKWVHAIPLSRLEVEHWLDEFGIEAGSDRAPAAGGEASEQPAGTDRESESVGGREPDDAPRPVELDEATRRLIDESHIDPDELDMDRWV